MALATSKTSAWSRWTWRRFGWFGSRRTRDRCWTKVPAWASPSTPRPTTRVIDSLGTLLNRWVLSRLTATTRGGGIPSSSRTAVDRDHLTGHVRRRRGAQPGHRGGNLVRLAQATHRYHLLVAVHVVLPRLSGLGGEVPLQPRNFRYPRLGAGHRPTRC